MPCCPCSMSGYGGWVFKGPNLHQCKSSWPDILVILASNWCVMACNQVWLPTQPLSHKNTLETQRENKNYTENYTSHFVWEHLWIPCEVFGNVIWVLLGCISFPSASILVSALDNLTNARYVLIITLYPFWFFFFYHLGFCKLSIPALKKTLTGLRVGLEFSVQDVPVDVVHGFGKDVHYTMFFVGVAYTERRFEPWLCLERAACESSINPLSIRSRPNPEQSIARQPRINSKIHGHLRIPCQKNLNTNHGETRSTRTR